MNKHTQIKILYLFFLLVFSNIALSISLGSFEQESNFISQGNKTLELYVQNDNTNNQEIILSSEGVLTPYLQINETDFIIAPNQTHSILVTIRFPDKVTKKEDTYIIAKEKKSNTDTLLVLEQVKWRIPITISDTFIALPVPQEEIKKVIPLETPIKPEPTEEIKKTDDLLTANVVDESAKLTNENDEGTNANFSVGTPEKGNQTLRPTQIFFAVLSILLGITIINITFLQKKTTIPKMSVAGVVQKIAEKNTEEKEKISSSTIIQQNNINENKGIDLEVYSVKDSLMQESKDQEMKKIEEQREPQDELQAYIETQVESGFLIIDISEALLRAGWDAEQIDIATKEVFSKMKK